MVAAIAAVAVVGAAVISSEASSDASDAQAQASGKAVDTRNAQFTETKRLLQPWITTGVDAQKQQGELIGLGGVDAQQAAIDRLQGGAEFGSMKKLGENAILQNASATGGLRGGKTNAALAQYDDSLLSTLINQQYARLGGLSTEGRAAASAVGGVGTTVAEGNANDINNAGAAAAGGILGQGNAKVGAINGLTNAAGVYMGQPKTTTQPAINDGSGNFGGGPVFA